MPPRLTMHLRTRGQRSDATPTRRKVGGKQRNPRHSNPSLPSLWDGPLRSRAAPQPASTPPPRSAPHGSRSTSHPRRHKAARLPKSRRKPQRAGTHSLECWPALTEREGKPGTLQSPHIPFCRGKRGDAAPSPRSKAAKVIAEYTDSKSFHAAPKARQPATASPHRLCLKDRAAFQKLMQIAASQSASNRRGPTLTESGKEDFEHCDFLPIMTRREAGGKTGNETSDSKSFHAAPKARPPSGQDGRRGNPHPHPPQNRGAQRLAPSPALSRLRTGAAPRPASVLSRLCTGAAPRPRNRPQAGAAAPAVKSPRHPARLKGRDFPGKAPVPAPASVVEW